LGAGNNCGKLSAVLHWYQEEYRHACEQVLCGALDDEERSFLLEQHELSEALRAQPQENPDRLSFDESIQRMAGAEEIRLPID